MQASLFSFFGNIIIPVLILRTEWSFSFLLRIFNEFLTS